MGQAALAPAGGGVGLPPNDWRFMIRTISLENRPVTINKEQYYFGKELGEGAFGCVYSARQQPTNKPVAVKVVSLATLTPGMPEMMAESIITEIKMSKRLAKASNNVVHMYDFDFHRHSGLAFLVMELGERNLEKFLASQPRLTPQDRKTLWRQLVGISTVLHNNNIVHLDIKPDNLVLFPNGRIKLVDLGIAQKAYEQRVGHTGTPPYSAPEVTTIPPNQVIAHTSKADVWSWGAVLYRVTYVQPPGYRPPCHHPPRNQNSSRDANLVDVLRRTLVLNPRERVDPPWLARHPYTISN